MPESQKSFDKQYKNIWESIQDSETPNLINSFSESYKDFISYSKTERRAVQFCRQLAQAKGFKPFSPEKKYKPGDKIFFINRDKNIFLYTLGTKALEEGINILAAHIDVPRLDLKPNPLYEDSSMALLETHYYGGIKKYQWATIPLALYGVIIKADGTKIEISIGDDANDPVFYISDLLIHLSKDQLKKTLAEGISGDDLNVLCGSIPLVAENDTDKKEKDPIKKNILKLLNEKYGIIEEDLVGSEFELVPSGFARDVGFDRSMVAGYGHDDRSCSFAALRAILDMEGTPDKTSCVMLVDKEEIGSYGNTGLEGDFFVYTLLELLGNSTKNAGELTLKRALLRSIALSADVTAAVDPNYPGVEDKKNAAFLNKGVVLKKYTGSRGKSGASDANAEFVSYIKHLFNAHQIVWQTGELGKVDQGGGGTVAFILARLNMEVLDMGIPLLSMHAPMEILAKADLFMAYKAYKLFLEKGDFRA